MPIFKVYFEIYGKKMVAKVSADNKFHAQKVVQDKIIFHKVEQSNDPMDEFNDIVDKLTKK